MKQRWSRFKEEMALIVRGYKYLVEIGGGQTLACYACEAAISAVIPLITLYFSGQLIDELAGARNVERLALLAGLAVGIGLVLLLARSFCGRRKEALYTTMWQDMYMLYSRKLLKMDYQDVEDVRVQEKLDKIKQLQNWGRGLVILHWAVSDLVEGIVGVLSSLVLALGLFFAPTPYVPGMAGIFASGWGTVIIIAVLLTSFIAFKAISDKNTKAWDSMGDEMTLVNRLFMYFNWILPNDHKQGKDMRLYNEIDIMQEELDYFINISEDVKEKHSYTIGWTSAVTAVFPYLLSGVVYLVVTAKAWCGAIGIGGIVQYVGAMSRFAGSLQKFVKKLTEVISNNEFLRETFEFLDRENTKYQGTIPTEKRLDNEFLIEFKDVSFKYPGTDAWALRHLNLTLRIGERLAVVGRNGSGKTTMIKLLCRLYDPTEGVITLNGIDIRKYNYDEYMALFSVVFQDYHLFSFQLGQSVAASVKYDKERVLHDLREAGLGELLEKMPQGLDTYLNKDFDENGMEFSGGEAQKTAMARALYKDAPLLVLDEPTAALDPVAESEVYRRFDEIAGKKTAVCISHRLSSCRFCDRIAVFRKGQMVQLGSHDKLLEDEHGAYRLLWDAQARYYAEENIDMGDILN
ncbi:MAG: ABC transporter ATP-binding protein [Acutalibacter sp.]|jgi:ATP-binding cassette subfamily B protein|uniref:ABC transporter ATP-binding protein n=1 Tax=Acutalibacter sp. TaxID=1918636 RepID=UPI00216CEA95|nr:ABC transporter ATP-binding protein [Acutalibacter sp.]MCI9225069.1 ABC transporter ATP-binding protein [Acutalibacter sp.]